MATEVPPLVVQLHRATATATKMMGPRAPSAASACKRDSTRDGPPCLTNSAHHQPPGRRQRPQHLRHIRHRWVMASLQRLWKMGCVCGTTYRGGTAGRQLHPYSRGASMHTCKVLRSCPDVQQIRLNKPAMAERRLSPDRHQSWSPQMLRHQWSTCGAQHAEPPSPLFWARPDTRGKCRPAAPTCCAHP